MEDVLGETVENQEAKVSSEATQVDGRAWNRSEG